MVDVPSSYNAIIGRTWLHRMRAVSFTYHQMIKFPGSNGIEKIMGNQKVAQQCFISIIKKALKAHWVQIVEVPYHSTIEDGGGNPVEKVVEGLKKIQVNETDPERYFQIRKTLTKDEDAELIKFLKERVDVFVRAPKEISGVDSVMICRHLNMNPQHQTMKVRKKEFIETQLVGNQLSKKPKDSTNGG